MKTVTKRYEEVIPSITDHDVHEIERRFEVAFDEQRRDVLRSNASFDVQACPGSGKTTLLVAKLAILAKKWPYSRRGICVLSHTNVARQEIEDKLSGTGVGERLLTYPHFVGTIHGFVNDFLALPLLRSEGRLIRLIDDDACFSWMRKRLLCEPVRFGLGQLVHRQRTLDSNIRALVCDGNLSNLPKPGNVDDRQMRTLKSTKAAAIAKGLYYHEDMFAAAERLLKSESRVIDFACWRFPVVFIDEMQDTSEYQGRLLAQIFPIARCAIRQRFGDSNQAIFDHGQSRTKTDAFPGSETRGIMNSQRFGQAIATKSQPLAPNQPQPGLTGEGPPPGWLTELTHQNPLPCTIFLFGPDSLKRVLPEFAQLLVRVFPPEARRSKRFTARAIGFVGRSERSEKASPEKSPRSLGDYFPGYEPRITRLEPQPERLADFIHLAQRQRIVLVDCSAAIATVSRGILQLIEFYAPDTVASSARGFSRLRELISSDPSALRLLQDLLWRWCVEATPLCQAEWTQQLRDLRKALSPVLGSQGKKTDATAFCEWSTDYLGRLTDRSSGKDQRLNRYRFPEENPDVEIEVGTIHRAKGQTHTATLVLETFSHKHDIGDLLDWLVGEKHGAEGNISNQRIERLRLIYTAMTRPTHLLCLAMREQALDTKRDRNATLSALQDRGWHIKFL